jgi:hypothetical protein
MGRELQKREDEPLGDAVNMNKRILLLTFPFDRQY